MFIASVFASGDVIVYHVLFLLQFAANDHGFVSMTRTIACVIVLVENRGKKTCIFCHMDNVSG